MMMMMLAEDDDDDDVAAAAADDEEDDANESVRPFLCQFLVCLAIKTDKRSGRYRSWGYLLLALVTRLTVQFLQGNVLSF